MHVTVALRMAADDLYRTSITILGRSATASQGLVCPLDHFEIVPPHPFTPPHPQGLVCPLDQFEIVLFSLSGPDGKTYPLCPYCFNCPPFESCAAGGNGGPQAEPLASACKCIRSRRPIIARGANHHRRDVKAT